MKVCPPDHKHGKTGTCYVSHKCRCDDCRAGIARSARQRTRQKAYGTHDWHERFVDAAPVREHIRRLMDAGMGWRQIARVSGVGNTAIEQLIYGRKGSVNDPRKGEPLKRVLKAKAVKIMAVRATIDTLASGAVIPASQTRVLARSLVAIGWSFSEIAGRVGMAPSNFSTSLRGEYVTVETARRVRDVWRELCMKPRVSSDWRTKASISRARAMAKANGWVSPLGLDDLDVAEVHVDDVDEVEVELAMSGESVRLTPAERVEAVRRLTGRGVSAARIAERLQVHPDMVTRWRREAA